METWKIIVLSLIPLYALVVFLLLSPLISYLERSSYIRNCVHTKHFLASSAFGLVTYVCGNIGAGKTTCCSGIANMFSLIKENQASAKMEEIRNLFPKVDFNLVDGFIEQAFHQFHILNTNSLLSFLLEHDVNLQTEMKHKYVDTRLYPVSKISLLRDYIEADLALLRNNYVYFLRRGFYCWHTDTWAMTYNPRMIDIKDCHSHKDYSILRYSTIFEDEKVLSGKVSTNSNQVSKEDGGGDTFYRLIRHLGKGTLHYIATSQDFGRVVKNERELATGVFYIRKRKELLAVTLKSIGCDILLDLIERWQYLYLLFATVISDYKVRKYSRLVQCWESESSAPVDKWESIIDKNRDRPYLKVSRIRSFICKLKDVKNREFADGFISYRGIYYTCASDVGKAKENAMGQVFDLDLCFPIAWCYGSTDTYAFSIVHDYLVNESESRAYDDVDFSSNKIPEVSDDEFDEFIIGVLSKNKEKMSRMNKCEEAMEKQYDPFS